MNRNAIIFAGIIILVITNTLCFVLMGMDKRRAQRAEWRISEKTLFLSCICFGALGGVLGMRHFHHKTHHWYFRVFFPVLLVLQVILLAVGAYFLFR